MQQNRMDTWKTIPHYDAIWADNQNLRIKVRLKIPKSSNETFAWFRAWFGSLTSTFEYVPFLYAHPFLFYFHMLGIVCFDLPLVFQLPLFFFFFFYNLTYEASMNRKNTHMIQIGVHLGDWHIKWLSTYKIIKNKIMI